MEVRERASKAIGFAKMLRKVNCHTHSHNIILDCILHALISMEYVHVFEHYDLTCKSEFLNNWMAHLLMNTTLHVHVCVDLLYNDRLPDQ